MSRRLIMQDNSGTASIIGGSPYDLVADPDNAEARYRLNSSGAEQTYTSTDFAYTTVGTWLVSGTNSQFEVRATAVSGTVTSGTMNTWEALSTSREWTAAKTFSVGVKQAVITIEIRRASTGVVVDTATVDLGAEIEL